MSYVHLDLYNLINLWTPQAEYLQASIKHVVVERRRLEKQAPQFPFVSLANMSDQSYCGCSLALKPKPNSLPPHLLKPHVAPKLAERNQH